MQEDMQLASHISYMVQVLNVTTFSYFTTLLLLRGLTTLIYSHSYIQAVFKIKWTYTHSYIKNKVLSII